MTRETHNGYPKRDQQKPPNYIKSKLRHMLQKDEMCLIYCACNLKPAPWWNPASGDKP